MLSSLLRNRNLYWINLTLILLHELDAAYRQEWQITQLPLTIDLFLLVSALLIPIALWGLIALARHQQQGVYYSLFMALFGITTFMLHLSSPASFGTVVSQGILWAVLAFSVLQGGVAIRTLLHLSRSGKMRGNRTSRVSDL